jgi:hypothetical protein
MPGPQRPTDDGQSITALAKAIPNGRAVAAVAGLERAGMRHDREQSAQLAGHVF